MFVIVIGQMVIVNNRPCQFFFSFSRGIKTSSVHGLDFCKCVTKLDLRHKMGFASQNGICVTKWDLRHFGKCFHSLRYDVIATKSVWSHTMSTHLSTFTLRVYRSPLPVQATSVRGSSLDLRLTTLFTSTFLASETPFS